MRFNKIANLFLGLSMFAFGFLKFFSPFKDWYATQISASRLGQTSYVLGIVGELAIGIILLALILFRDRIPAKGYRIVNLVASGLIVVMMVTATIVHLHPDVPASVLPLKIKPPFIPIFFLLMALINMVILMKLTTASPVYSGSNKR